MRIVNRCKQGIEFKAAPARTGLASLLPGDNPVIVDWHGNDIDGILRRVTRKKCFFRELPGLGNLVGYIESPEVGGTISSTDVRNYVRLVTEDTVIVNADFSITLNFPEELTPPYASRTFKLEFFDILKKIKVPKLQYISTDIYDKLYSAKHFEGSLTDLFGKVSRHSVPDPTVTKYILTEVTAHGTTFISVVFSNSYFLSLRADEFLNQAIVLQSLFFTAGLLSAMYAHIYATARFSDNEHYLTVEKLVRSAV